VRRESAQAVGHWWEVCPETVWRWKKALGVGPTTEGTSRLHSAYSTGPWAVEALAKAQAKAGDPERRAKIAAAHRGKPRPPHVVQAVAEAHRGTHHTEETRRKMSETRRRKGMVFPGVRPWTSEEDELARTLPTQEAARRTGRTAVAVRTRRRVLGMPDGRRRENRSRGGGLPGLPVDPDSLGLAQREGKPPAPEKPKARGKEEKDR
jgi:hypothetical protein